MSPLLGVPLEQAPAVAREWGFDGIEIVVGGGEAELARWSDAAWRRDLRRRAAQAGCAVPSICPVELNSGNLGNEDPNLRQHAERVLSVLLDAAVDLESSVILVPFFGKADLKGPDTRMQHVIEGIAPLAERAVRARVRLALETTLPAPDLLNLIGRIASPAVGVYYDLANAVWQGYEPAAEIRRLASAIVQVHIKDNIFDPGGWGGFRVVPLGEGRVDFASCAASLRSIRYGGWLVLETAVSGGDRRRSATDQLRFTCDHFH